MKLARHGVEFRLHCKGVSQRRTRLVGGLGLCISSHSLNSLVHLLKDVITVHLELAHHAVVGVDHGLFFLFDLQQGRMLFDDPCQSVGPATS
jgi:hypothetical protein